MTPFLVMTSLVAGVASALPALARRPRAAGALKMLAATAYVAVAVRLGAAGSTYGAVVLLALGLSWLGDLALLGSSRGAFLAGLSSFLLAHLAYGAAFLVRGVTVIPAAAGALAMGVVALLVLRWLGRHDLPRRMRVPVALYLATITLMVALAVGTPWPLVAVGAVLFAASDVLVARERFVRSAPANRLVGRPLYFVAQLLLAASVG